MLPIYICDDQKRELDMIKGFVDDYICFHFDKLLPDVYAFSNPFDLLKHLKANAVTGIYLLDYNLKCKMDGMYLAVEIRKYDPMGFIIFISNCSECAPLTLEYRIEALTYIKKEMPNLKYNIYNALNCAYSRYNSFLSFDYSDILSILKFKQGERYYDFEYHDIIYISCSKAKQHQVEVHTFNKTVSFYHTIEKLEKTLPQNLFFRCNRSTIINLSHVSVYDKSKKILTMTDGSEIDISKRKTSELINRLKYHYSN